MSRVIGATASMILGNYAFQAFAGMHWFIASKRSFFQAVAVFIIWMESPKMKGEKKL